MTEEIESTPTNALLEIDRTWYNNSPPRFMDAATDYAGQELFVVDGDALLSYVLENSLLALGRKDDPAFALLHAKWLLERTVEDLFKRDCTFDIAFFNCNKHMTLLTGNGDDYISASRALARQLLKAHLSALGLIESVMEFDDLEDEDWMAYYHRKKPMFILGSDGGLPSPDELSEEVREFESARILSQRHFLFVAVHSKTPIVLLSPAEFEDGKIMTYVAGIQKMTGNSSSSTSRLEPSLLEAIESAQENLDAATFTLPSVEVALSSFDPPATLDSFLVAFAKTLLSSSPATTEDQKALLYLYIIHILILPSLSLPSRAQPPLPPNATLTSTFLAQVLAALGAVLANEELAPDDILKEVDLDGAIFVRLVQEAAVLESSDGAEVVCKLVGEVVQKRVAAIWSLVLPNDSAPSFSLLSSLVPPFVPTSTSSLPANSLLPFSEPTFTPLLSSLKVVEDEDDSPASMPSALPRSSAFSDGPAWVGPKPALPTHLGGAPPVQLTPRERKKRDRKDQRYMAAMQKSAASLTGALGTSLKRETIPAVGKLSKARGGTTSAPASGGWKEREKEKGAKSNGKVKEKVLTSKEKLLAENAAKKQAEETALNASWWTEKLASIKPLPLSGQLTNLTLLIKNRRASDKWLGPEMALKRIDTYLRLWIADERREESEVADDYRVKIARDTRDLLDKYKKGDVLMSEKQGKAAIGTLEALGLGCLVPVGLVFGAGGAAVDDGKKGSGGKDKAAGGKKPKPGAPGSGKKDEKDKKEEKKDEVKLTFSFVSLSKGGKMLHEFMGLGKEDPLEFQLRCMGEWMVRSLDSAPDSRVSFEPDKWQRDVLDLIDADESMLVVAPTSSGKTFISFAAMEKVLRESDDGVCVYLAPTKALVNQVAAEVFARFSKDVPGANMWAIHTRDYRINNPNNCQILVTVPHMLSKMLLDPALAKVWAPRLRRIILDEIHSISDEDGGAIWEQVLLLNPAPIIGLSATVGAPERFADWLASVERQRGRKFTLIKHTHRYNALRKFAYAPKFPLAPIQTLTEHKSTKDVFAHIHPISALALGNSELPEDLSLEPMDTLTLWRAMTASGEVGPKLTPSTYFSDTPSVAIRDVIEYEKELKTLLVSWMETPGAADDPASPYRKVVAQLEGPLRLALAESESEIEDGGDETFFKLFLPLLADLNSQGQLPAILFNYDRNACERIAERILHDLEDAESRWRMKSPEWKRRVAKAKEDEKLAKIKAKAQESAGRNKKDEEGDSRAEEESANTFDPDAPSEEFSFVGKGISHVEFLREIAELSWLNLDSWLINALRRGVGVHHAGLNRHYRTLVENLFRRGVLRVVISTGTLALGVNAPARTTVFAGDSIHLTPLNYRQAAGRAGRRGFDTLGNVVFLGVSLDRIQRLFLSRLPKLGGTFPLSATLVLRLHNLLHGSEGAVLPKDAVESMLSLPQLSVGNETGSEQTKFFVRAIVEYLRRSGLLDENGSPMNLYGIVSNLYPYEPFNFAFMALLRSGELHHLTREFNTAPDDTMKSLLVVLATLFARVPRRAQSPETFQLATRNSTSVVILPPVPARIEAVLTDHDKAVTSIFANYVYQYSRQHGAKIGLDNVLPLSKEAVGGQTENLPGSLSDTLEATALPVTSRSAFVALSGHGDSYLNVKEISTTGRTGVVVTTHAVPALPWLTSPQHQLDAYLVDFFRHGSLDVVVRDNSISRGDVWYALQDFDIALTAIKGTLESLIRRSTTEHEEDNDSDDGQQDDDEPISADLTIKPSNVDEADWVLYQAVTTLHQVFHAKFLEIFA